MLFINFCISKTKQPKVEVERFDDDFDEQDVGLVELDAEKEDRRLYDFKISRRDKILCKNVKLSKNNGF